MDAHKVVYRFDRFADAHQVAFHIQSECRAAAKIVSRETEFVVHAELNFEQELAIALAMTDCQSNFRTGVKYTLAERDFIITEFLHWNTTQDIANKLRRTSSAIVATLGAAGLWWSPARTCLPETLDERPIAYEDNYLRFSQGAALAALFDAGVVSSFHGEETDGYVHVSQFDHDELRRIVAFIYTWGEDSDTQHEACNLASAGGLYLEAYHLGRQIGGGSEFGYRMLCKLQGLPPLLLYQREVLRSHLAARLILEYPLLIGSMRKLSHDQYPDVRMPCTKDYGFSSQDFKVASDELLAFANSNDLNELERLTGSGNRAAAWFLARHYDIEVIRGGNYRGEDAERAERICGDYQPDPAAIRQLLKSNLVFDTQYATALAHLMPAWAIELDSSPSDKALDL